MSDYELCGPGKITVEMAETGVRVVVECSDVRCVMESGRPEMIDVPGTGLFNRLIPTGRLKAKKMTVTGTPTTSDFIDWPTTAKRLALAVLMGDDDAALALADEVLMTFHAKAKEVG